MLKRLGLEGCADGIDSQKVRVGVCVWRARVWWRAALEWPWQLGAQRAGAKPLQPPTDRQPHHITSHHDQVFGYALYKNGRYASIKYPIEGYGLDVAGRSFHHGRFVQQLRLAAAAMPGVTAREATVRRLLNGAFRSSMRRACCVLCVVCVGSSGAQTTLSTDAYPTAAQPTDSKTDEGNDWNEGEPVSGVQYKTGDGEVRTAKAHLTVVCDGMYSQFRWADG
jgi:hypothetical protein